MQTLMINAPNEKQRLFLEAKQKYIAYGGARGGGKSWAVRTKAKLMAMRYPGIRMLIVRRTYPELMNNHINELRKELIGIAKYNDKDKVLKFNTGSTLNFMYCARDGDLDRLQGVEYDIIFIDEATQLSEYQMKTISACLRGANDFPKRIYYTCNPGGQGHGYIKRLFIDRHFEGDEKPEEYVFIQAFAKDNKILMEKQPEYIDQLMVLPPKLKRAWLEGDWNIFEGQFFEDFHTSPDKEKCDEAGISIEDAFEQRRWTHVIKPFDIPKTWNIYRSYDFGSNKPFSCAWWAVDYDGVIYRILELYGWTGVPNEGLKWNPEQQFAKIAEVEREHPYLRGKDIQGVADPSIWDSSRGPSVAEVAAHHHIYFTPGDNHRIPGWMQMHYRFMFDEEGYPMMYVFETCKAFIRTIPTLQYSEVKPEDLDTDGEDHAADEARYFCMSRPIAPRQSEPKRVIQDDPLNMHIHKARLRRI